MKQMALDLTLPAPANADEDLVLRYVRRIIGPKVPTYVHRVERVVRDGRRVIADLRVFDGALERVEFSGDLDGFDFINMRWHAAPGTAPSGWDERRKRWRRYPDMVMAGEEADAAYARLARAEDAKARRTARRAAE